MANAVQDHRYWRVAKVYRRTENPLLMEEGALILPETLRTAGQDVLRYHDQWKAQDHYVYGREEETLANNAAVIVYLGIVPLLLGWCILLSKMNWVGLLAMPILILAGIGVYRRTLSILRKRKAKDNSSQRYQRSIHLLTSSNDLAAVGPLCEIIHLHDMSIYVPEALRRLLPQLQVQDSCRLTDRQRANLLRILTEPDPNRLELQRATVKALARVGDARAAQVLGRLAAGEFGAATSVALQQEARTAWNQLQERLDPGYAGRELLRATTAPIESQESLLRPIASTPETAPQELLRAHQAK